MKTFNYEELTKPLVCKDSKEIRLEKIGNDLYNEMTSEQKKVYHKDMKSYAGLVLPHIEMKIEECKNRNHVGWVGTEPIVLNIDEETTNWQIQEQVEKAIKHYHAEVVISDPVMDGTKAKKWSDKKLDKVREDINNSPFPPIATVNWSDPPPSVDEFVNSLNDNKNQESIVEGLW